MSDVNEDGAGNGVSDNLPATARFAKRVAELLDEKQEIADQVREVLTEAKEAGCTKGGVQRTAKRIRESEEQRLSREQIETESDQALFALGLLNGRPLSEAKQADLPLEKVTPYEDGRRAYRAGSAASLNPYPVGGAQHEAWGEGWTDEFAVQRGAVNGKAVVTNGPGEGVPTPAAAAPKRRRRIAAPPTSAEHPDLPPAA